MFYLLATDRETPVEETLAEVDKLHWERYFRRFGISNFKSWEVAKICEIREKHGYIVFHGLGSQYGHYTHYNPFNSSIKHVRRLNLELSEVHQFMVTR